MGGAIAAALVKAGLGEALAAAVAQGAEAIIRHYASGKTSGKIDVPALRERRRQLRVIREAKLLSAK